MDTPHKTDDAARKKLRVLERSVFRHRIEIIAVQLLSSAVILAAFFSLGRLGVLGFLAVLSVVLVVSVWFTRSTASKLKALFAKTLDIKRQIGEFNVVESAVFKELDIECSQRMGEKSLWVVALSVLIFVAVLMTAITTSWLVSMLAGLAVVAAAARLMFVSHRIRKIRREFAKNGLVPVTDQLWTER